MKRVLGHIFYYYFVGVSHFAMPNIAREMHVNFNGWPSSTSHGIHFCTWLFLWPNNFDSVQTAVCPLWYVPNIFFATVSSQSAAPSVLDNGGNPVFIESRA